MTRSARPCLSELGRLLNMSEVEWEVWLMEQRVERMMNPRLRLSLWTVCKLILGTLLGKPTPREIPL